MRIGRSPPGPGMTRLTTDATGTGASLPAALYCVARARACSTDRVSKRGSLSISSRIGLSCGSTGILVRSLSFKFRCGLNLYQFSAPVAVKQAVYSKSLKTIALNRCLKKDRKYDRVYAKKF